MLNMRYANSWLAAVSFPTLCYQSGNATQEAEFVQGIVEDMGDW